MKLFKKSSTNLRYKECKFTRKTKFKRISTRKQKNKNESLKGKVMPDVPMLKDKLKSPKYK